MSLRVLFVSAVVVLVASVCAFPRAGRNRTVPDIIGAITSKGYPAESHYVTTEDGYILGVQRIPYGKAGPSAGPRPLVLLMHGLMGASIHYISLGEEAGIAYNLADAGYDVWMGNARGNVFSRQHVSLDPDDQKNEFFDFSWEEIATIDVPAIVDYALAVAGEQSLHYIGHSQGGTAFLVLNSMKPEYNDKFISAHLLAGVGYKNNFPHTQLRAAAQLTNTFYTFARAIGLVEIGDLSDLPIDLFNQGYKARDNCVGDVQYRDFCNLLGLDSILGEEDEGLFIGGAALKQFAHYGQNIKDRAFRRWDYGILTNRRVYGTITPPSYDLSLITVPTTMHYTVSDELLDEQDVLSMASAMPKAEVRKVARETFSHVNFVNAADVRELVTNYIIDRLRFADVAKESS